MDKTKAAYIAGVIDGEGSILMRQIRTSYSFSFQSIIVISNTNKELLDIICDWLKLGKVSTAKPTKGCRMLYHWTVSSQDDCRQVLEYVLPHLIAKRKQGELVYQFVCNHIKRSKIGWKVNAIPPIPDWEIDIFNQLKRYNRRTIKEFIRPPQIRHRIKDMRCPICNSIFNCSHPRQKYCSAKCSKEAIKARDRIRNRIRYRH